MQKWTLTLATFMLSATLWAQSPEFRGAWVSTVFNSDWPSRAGLSSQQQQDELAKLFDFHAQNGINAVIFQVRTTADALYASPYEPWSQWLTGKQGKAPEPFYDPLQMAIELAHARGIELHAWLNPYRAQLDTARRSAPGHVSRQHPEWCIAYGKRSYLDPGLPQVRAFIVQIVKDIILRY